MASINTLSVNDVAFLIGKVEEEIALPNGATRMGLNWKPADLAAIEAALKPLSEAGQANLIDGIGPQWLMLNITHALHPSSIRLADPKVSDGSVAIDDRRKPGVTSGDLTFVVTETDSAVKVEYSSETPISADRLPAVVPPVTAQGKPVALTGRTATWAVVQIGMAYAHVVPAVFVFQPGQGFVCAVTHNQTFKVGDVYSNIEDIPTIVKVQEVPEKQEVDYEALVAQAADEVVVVPTAILRQLVDLAKNATQTNDANVKAISAAEKLLS